MIKVDQVGGDHYQQGDKPQHWDLVVTYQWDYFQAQITKYLMRWKTKHTTPEKKLEDLKKARSFLDKYITEYERFLPKEPMRVGADGFVPLSKYEEDHNKFIHDDTFLCEGGWGNGLNLYTHRATRKTVVARSLQDAAAQWAATQVPPR